MSDTRIRQDIKALLPRVFKNGKTILIEEFEISSGKSRADMAIISDRIIGIEIKGPQDTLERLPNQVEQYSKCFDLAILVIDKSMLEKAMQLIPDWWGIITVESLTSGNKYKFYKKPILNNNVDIELILKLLWKEEAMELFSNLSGTKPPSRINKQMLRNKLLSDYPTSLLKQAGIELIKNRLDWRSVQINN